MTEDQSEEKATKENVSPGTIYDDAFRKMAEYYPDLFIALINEVFDMEIPSDAEIRQLRNEYLDADGKFITDVAFEINRRRFHFECQSRPDGTIFIRMVEYSIVVAMDQMRSSRSDILQLPDAAVVYLRHNGNTPDNHIVTLKNSLGDTMPMPFHCIKVQDVPKEEIFRKNLLVFLPYYLMRYEDNWDKLEKNEHDRERFYLDVSDIIVRLQEMMRRNNSLRPMVLDLLEMMQKISRYLLRKHEKIEKGVEDIMIDRIGVLPSDLLRQIAMEKAAREEAEEAREEERKAREEAEEARRKAEGKVEKLLKLLAEQGIVPQL